LRVFGYITENASEGLTEIEFEQLTERLKENNLSTRDLFSELNVGRTKDGKAVKIDFDIVRS
jgi:glucuronate isomerase